MARPDPIQLPHFDIFLGAFGGVTARKASILEHRGLKNAGCFLARRRGGRSESIQKMVAHRKRRDLVAEIFLEVLLLSEYQFPNDRMQTIRSNHDVKISCLCALECDMYTVLLLLDQSS